MNSRGFGIMAFLVTVILLSGPVVNAEQSVTGLVQEAGFSGPVIDGVKYNTGRETSYTPDDYRPVKGDTVTLTYYNKTMPNGQEGLAVSSLTLVKKDPNRKELANPAEGTVREVTRRAVRIDFPAAGQEIVMDFKRGMEFSPKGWKPAVGDKVKVHYDKVPSRFTGGIVHVMSRIEKMN
jgi:hypothetical protein